MNDIRTKNTEEYLRYDFSGEELLEIAKTLARETQEFAAPEDRKKQVMSDFKAQLDAKATDVALLSRKVSNGHEYRMIGCEVRFNDPMKGKKTVIRMDTGEIVKTAFMSGDEMQENLFEAASDGDAAAE
jgi:hypothetical protein